MRLSSGLMLQLLLTLGRASRLQAVRGGRWTGLPACLTLLPLLLTLGRAASRPQAAGGCLCAMHEARAVAMAVAQAVLGGSGQLLGSVGVGGLWP